jgi:hypothetical protein
MLQKFPVALLFISLYLNIYVFVICIHYSLDNVSAQDGRNTGRLEYFIRSWFINCTLQQMLLGRSNWDVVGVTHSTHKTAVFWINAPITIIALMMEAAGTSVLLLRANQNLEVKDTCTGW